MQNSLSQEGQKIKGLFGFFDILGYKELNRNNDIDTLIRIFKKYILSIDEKSITIGGIDPKQMFSFLETKTLVFSDTIILYQEIPTGIGAPNILGAMSNSWFIAKSCLLLRYAFEGGIPLKGAISYGEFFIHNKSFLGKPIIEAYEQQKNLNWSGAILCESSRRYLYMDNNSLLNFCFNYNIPEHPNKSSNGWALCWDDFALSYMGLANSEELPRLNCGLSKGTPDEPSIRLRVEKSFSKHNKSINHVADKIDNTTKFILNCNQRPLLGPVRLQFV